MALCMPPPCHARPLPPRARACSRPAALPATRRRLGLRAVAEAGQGQKQLVVAGSANVDLTLQVRRMPAAGETLDATSETFPGGKGANQAVAAARLAYPTSFVGQVGSDAYAGLLRDALGREGMDLEHLVEVEGPTGTAVVLLQPSGENSIIIVGGANTAEWDLRPATTELLRGAGILLLQREVPEEVNLRLARTAQEAGVPVVLDCGGIEGPVSPELLKCLAYLSPNETELARLTDMPTGSEEELRAAAGAVLEQGVPVVLLKCGARGSLLLTREGAPHSQPAFPVDKVVDTTGAGDCYTAAFGVALLEGLEPPRAMRFAAAAAALCIQGSGAQPSMPTRDRVDGLLRDAEG